MQKHGVRYVVVGGDAVVYHGYARFTGDVDVFYSRDTQNVRRLLLALTEFWGGVVPRIDSTADLRQAGVVFRLGVPPNRLDLLNRIDGVSFEAAWRGRDTVAFRTAGLSTEVHYMGVGEMIRNKRASGRPKDLDDLRYLLAAREHKRLARRRGGRRSRPR